MRMRLQKMAKMGGYYGSRINDGIPQSLRMIFPVWLYPYSIQTKGRILAGLAL